MKEQIIEFLNSGIDILLPLLVFLLLSGIVLIMILGLIGALIEMFLGPDND